MENAPVKLLWYLQLWQKHNNSAKHSIFKKTHAQHWSKAAILLFLRGLRGGSRLSSNSKTEMTCAFKCCVTEHNYTMLKMNTNYLHRFHVLNPTNNKIGTSCIVCFLQEHINTLDFQIFRNTSMKDQQQLFYSTMQWNLSTLFPKARNNTTMKVFLWRMQANRRRDDHPD